jgi:hypothetical protein
VARAVEATVALTLLQSLQEAMEQLTLAAAAAAALVTPNKTAALAAVAS